MNDRIAANSNMSDIQISIIATYLYLEMCHIIHCHNRAMRCPLQKMLIHKMNQHELHFYQLSLISSRRANTFFLHTPDVQESRCGLSEMLPSEITAGVYLP